MDPANVLGVNEVSAVDSMSMVLRVEERAPSGMEPAEEVYRVSVVSLLSGGITANTYRV